jgi:quercetin dioxygenase-like cupin family protein
MKKKVALWTVVVGVALLISGLPYLVQGDYHAEQTAKKTAPTGKKGLSVRKARTVDLGPIFSSLKGRQLRMRVVQFEPGGFFGIHSHKDRPGVVYVLEGKLIDHRDGGANGVGPGDTWIEDKDTKHWVENRGTKPGVIIAVDIAKKR